MAIPILGDTLITDVRRLARIPDGDSALSDTEILRTADEEYEQNIMPELVRVARNHHLREDTEAIVTGQREYPMPVRAYGSEVRALFLVDTNGHETALVNRDMGRDARSHFRSSHSFVWLAHGIRFTADPPAGYTLKWVYVLRPAYLTKIGASSGGITNVTSTTITVDTTFAEFSTSNRLDIVSQREPFLYKTLDLLPTGVAGSVATFDAVDTAQVLPGDYISLAQYSPFFQGPREAYGLTTHATAAKVLLTLGYKNAHRAMEEDFLKKLEKAKRIFEERSQDATPHLVNPYSPLRTGGRFFR